ncbi:MAG: hypothetical protein PHN32_08990 [Actinomycetota bacterium]|jgi:beta-N-acetylhexosaminidase|nr:hypothetical protein [Actinomycetota bacterium]
MKKWLAILILLCICCLAPGCSQACIIANPDIRGQITSIEDRGENKAVLIEGKVQADTGYDKAWVTVTGSTIVLSQQSGEAIQVEADELKTGLQVQAVFTGPIMESYPVQTEAEQIVILNP